MLSRLLVGTEGTLTEMGRRWSQKERGARRGGVLRGDSRQGDRSRVQKESWLWGVGALRNQGQREGVPRALNGNIERTVSLCGPGPGSKRLGIDDDREAVPLTLQIIYGKVSEASTGPLPS